MAAKKLSKALAQKIEDRLETTTIIKHAGLTFKDRHYVMIVKSKRGELWNCGHLKDSSKASFTPLFEMSEKIETPYADQCKTVAEAIAAEWGNLPHFIDVRYIGTDLDPGPQAIQKFVVAARLQKLIMSR